MEITGFPLKPLFAPLTSQSDIREHSGLLTDAACNLHISVGVQLANQRRAPIAAQAYHLRTAAAAPLSEGVKGTEGKERTGKNGRCA